MVKTYGDFITRIIVISPPHCTVNSVFLAFKQFPSKSIKRCQQRPIIYDDWKQPIRYALIDKLLIPLLINHTIYSFFTINREILNEQSVATIERIDSMCVLHLKQHIAFFVYRLWASSILNNPSDSVREWSNIAVWSILVQQFSFFVHKKNSRVILNNRIAIIEKRRIIPLSQFRQRFSIHRAHKQHTIVFVNHRNDLQVTSSKSTSNRRQPLLLAYRFSVTASGSN